jgi:hypothetical protein
MPQVTARVHAQDRCLRLLVALLEGRAPDSVEPYVRGTSPSRGPLARGFLIIFSPYPGSKCQTTSCAGVRFRTFTRINDNHEVLLWV